MLQIPRLILDSSHIRRAFHGELMQVTEGHDLVDFRLKSIIIKNLTEINVRRRSTDGDRLNGDQLRIIHNRSKRKPFILFLAYILIRYIFMLYKDYYSLSQIDK